jgi:hypothetical protein
MGVDLNPRDQIFISIVVQFRGRAAELDVHPAAHEVRDQVLVGVPGLDVAVDVVCRVVQREVARVGVEITTTSDDAPQSAMSPVMT